MEDNNSISGRLLQYVQRLGVDLDSFAYNCGVSKRLLLNLKEGYSQTFRKIKKAYPLLDIKWLIHGDVEKKKFSPVKPITPAKPVTSYTPITPAKSIAITSELEIATIRQKMDSLTGNTKKRGRKNLIRDRLFQYMRYINMSVENFAESCSLSESYISTIGDKAPIKIFNRIYSAHPKLNPVWLQTGEGDMELGLYKDESEDKASLTEISSTGQEAQVTDKYEVLAELLKNTDEQISRLQTMIEQKVLIITALINKNKEEPL